MAESATLEQPANTAVESAPTAQTSVGLPAQFTEEQATLSRLSADEALERILGPSGEDDPAPVVEETNSTAETSGVVRDEKGRFAPKNTKEEAETTPPATDSEPALPADIEPEAYEKAIRAIRRAKTPKEILDTMNPAQILAWGTHLAEDQAKNDGFGNRIKELEARLVQPPAHTEPAQANSEPAAQYAKSLAELFDHVDFAELTKPFAELLGDEGANHVKALAERQHAAYRSAVERLGNTVDRALTDRDRALTFLLRYVAQQEDNGAWGKVGEAFPGAAKDDAQRVKLRQKAAALLQTGEYDNLQDAYSDAAKILFQTTPAVQKQQVQAEMAQAHKQRALATPTVPTAPPTPQRSKSFDQLQDDLIDAIEEKNKGVAGAAERVKQLEATLKTAPRRAPKK